MAPPQRFPPWLVELTKTVTLALGLPSQPNSCNVNHYASEGESVGLHKDDEPLFEAPNVIIVSLSLGSTRPFTVQQRGHKAKDI